MSRPIDLLALPCAGASATLYARWPRALPDWLRLRPLELPGRGARMDEPRVEDFDRLVTLLCQEIQPRGPYVLFGHSMGALLAHGIARRLHAARRAMPLALLVSGSPAPSRRDSARYADLDDAALLADLRRHGGTPEAVLAHPELRRLTLDTLAADYRVCASFSYRQTALLPLPIHAFAGRQDDIGAASVEAWGGETTGSFALDWFDGGHFFIRQHEDAVIAAVVRALGPLAATPRHDRPAPRAAATSRPG